MIIKKIILCNIRSYEYQEIKFPGGVNLLSGNVGSGKSTILLSVEFALFGIRRGEVSGSALLRNGRDSGYVILNLQVNGKDISIKRGLRRTNNGIAQDACYLSVNDITEQLTATELKQKILELLNYPQESLTKKSMVYRYTVYTPQEEMKTILLGEKELRLETLRNVFDIDKYQRIKENAKITISELRIKKKECAAMIYDLEAKKQRLLEDNLKLENLRLKIKYHISRNTNLQVLIDNIKKQIENIEYSILKLNELNKEIEVTSLNLKLKFENKIKNKQHHDQLLAEIESLGSNLIEEINAEELREKIDELNRLLIEKEKELRETLKIIIELKSKTSNSEEIKNKIQILDKCPLCEQEVSHKHKEDIISRENDNIERILNELRLYSEKEMMIEEELNRARGLLNEVKQKEYSLEVNKIRKENLKSRKELLDKLLSEINYLDNENTLLNEKQAVLSLELEKLNDVNEQYTKAKSSLDKLQVEQRQSDIEKAKLDQEINSLDKLLDDLKKEIEGKEKIKAKLEYYIELQDWLENFFVSLIELIERKVMMKVHNDFNSLFQNWFSMIMDSENIRSRLDEEFTPIIEQNGFDMEYENLSGGEKTASALAYRLALNQVINNIVSNVNTRDLIILDEPTDGFSSEQLDRLRLVLQELKMKQIIIVSHESKIESFVDNIIKVEKHGHVSNVN